MMFINVAPGLLSDGLVPGLASHHAVADTTIPFWGPEIFPTFLEIGDSSLKGDIHWKNTNVLCERVFPSEHCSIYSSHRA